MKTYLTACALLIATTSFAQLEKGKSYVSGQIGGTSANQTFGDPNISGAKKRGSYNVNVAYGYLFSSTWAVGLSLNVNGNNYFYGNNSGTVNGPTLKNTGYSVSPYVRKYFLVADKFYIHLDVGAKFDQSKSKYEQPDVPTTTSTVRVTSAYISPGLTYFVSNRFALTSSLGTLSYANGKQTEQTPANNVTQKTFTASFGLTSIAFGGSFFF